MTILIYSYFVSTRVYEIRKHELINISKGKSILYKQISQDNLKSDLYIPKILQITCFCKCFTLNF